VELGDGPPDGVACRNFPRAPAALIRPIIGSVMLPFVPMRTGLSGLPEISGASIPRIIISSSGPRT
jgi:hypothetical protein